MNVCEVYLDEQEHGRVRQAVHDVGHALVDDAGNSTLTLKRFSQSARDYKRQRGNLVDWIPPAPQQPSLGAELVRIDREASRARRAAFKDAGVQGRHLTLAEARHVISGALEACMDDRPPKASALLRGAGVSPADVSKLSSRVSQHIVTAWGETQDHPHREVMNMHGVLTGRHERNIKSGSLANAVACIYERAAHARDRQKITAQGRQLVDHEQRIKELEARLAAVEVGDNWKAIAERMRAEGASHNAIAQTIGKTKDAVAGYFRRCKR